MYTHAIDLFSFVIWRYLWELFLFVVNQKSFINELKTQSKNSQGCHHMIWNGTTSDEAGQVYYPLRHGDYSLDKILTSYTVNLRMRPPWNYTYCTEMMCIWHKSHTWTADKEQFYKLKWKWSSQLWTNLSSYFTTAKITITPVLYPQFMNTCDLWFRSYAHNLTLHSMGINNWNLSWPASNEAS